MDWQIGLFSAREVFHQHGDLNTDDEHQREQFIMQHPNLKQAGLFKVQSLKETDKAIPVIVLPVEGTTWNVISAIDIPCNLQDSSQSSRRASQEIRFFKGV